MGLILGIATILGGIAALAYFLERWKRGKVGAEALPQPGPLAIDKNVRQFLEQAGARTQEIIGFFPTHGHQWHNAGIIVPDDEASQGLAWLSDFQHRGGHVVYGPYAILRREGSYFAWFRLRFYLTDEDPLSETVRLDVTHGGIQEALLLRASDNDGRYRLYRIDFSYKANERIELRVEKLRPSKVWVDFTAICRPR